MTDGRIAAIFGTDPGGFGDLLKIDIFELKNFCLGPLFNLNSLDRLDVEDAIYTEGIHTNAGVTGFSQPITHAGTLQYFISTSIKSHFYSYQHSILIGEQINLVRLS